MAYHCTPAVSQLSVLLSFHTTASQPTTPVYRPSLRLRLTSLGPLVTGTPTNSLTSSWWSHSKESVEWWCLTWSQLHKTICLVNAWMDNECYLIHVLAMHMHMYMYMYMCMSLCCYRPAIRLCPRFNYAWATHFHVTVSFSIAFLTSSFKCYPRLEAYIQILTYVWLNCTCSAHFL